MRRSFFALLTLVIIVTSSNAQTLQRPKLVVGIMIDQMRWDYLYRFYDIFKPGGGFKRMMNQGFSCENTFIPYTPTVTAAGHTCVYTGSVPAVHGIVGNYWWDYEKKKGMYCTDDEIERGVGSSGTAGRMSPRNMLTTTICDELRLATNFKSKVIGIALKDRGSILPAGHTATAAYWYDPTVGNFITSTYYMKELPGWVNTFNNRKMVDSLYSLNWNLYLPKTTYANYCTEDVKPYENKVLGNQPGFPYDLSRFAGKDYGKIASTPYGNTMTSAMAEAAVKAENLGRNSVTDFLAVSFSSPDYIGHAFGPNSWEVLDNYARLDETLGKFFAFLDTWVGKGNYTAFLTADHGVAHVPNFSIENNLPGGAYNDTGVVKRMNIALEQKYGKTKLIRDTHNYLVVFNDSAIEAAQLNKSEMIQWTVNYLSQQKEISRAFAIKDLNTVPLTGKQREMINNGYYPSRCGDVQFILKSGYVEGNGRGTSHGLWNPYDSHIPLLWYGWGIKQGKSNKERYMTDIAPTLAGLLRIQMPSGSVGQVIEEALKQ
jgi:hypothetical protein